MIIQQLLQQTQEYAHVMQEFLSIVEAVRREVEVFDDCVSHCTDKTCIIWCDDGGVSSDLLGEYLAAYPPSESIEVFGVGLGAVSAALSAGYSVVGMIDADGYEEIDTLCMFVRESLSQGGYREIVMVSSQGTSELYPLSYDRVDQFVRRYELGVVSPVSHDTMVGGMDDIRQELVDQMMQYMIYGTLLHQKMDNVYMQSLSDNSEGQRMLMMNRQRVSGLRGLFVDRTVSV